MAYPKAIRALENCENSGTIDSGEKHGFIQRTLPIKKLTLNLSPLIPS
jgi:hypothetical protein